MADRGLSFTQNKKSVTVKPDAKLVSIPFDFENKSKRTITIARYDSACSCISARVAEPLGKMTYKPGEKGKIVVDFELGRFSGKVVKTLMLWTKDDPANAPSSVLTSEITIPSLFDVTPPTLFWDQKGNNKPQSFKIKVNNTQPIRILDLSGTNKNFPYELKTIRDGWEYEIIITPQDVNTPCMGILKITTDAAIKRFQILQNFVCVRRPRPAAVKP